MSKNLFSYANHPVPDLFAHMAASSLSRVSTYIPSSLLKAEHIRVLSPRAFFLALRANSFRRGVVGV
ncbi:hypothetical protein [Dyella caseinilytica]|uniref:Uncharacterized protein n=1 Tax=Dyella caseinilytica TaxID=1849581 RepID=A0ABX7GVM7_9GAMM|nr:hypothetical protein [Dyella caseinilytica]QRN54517.1 hypothetical protein ISN74_03880 [Dyella caseinilytica]GFZ94868.1 hypothetical protein GCM10011408_13570 [Dyella caseinilytica]